MCIVYTGYVSPCAHRDRTQSMPLMRSKARRKCCRLPSALPAAAAGCVSGTWSTVERDRQQLMLDVRVTETSGDCTGERLQLIAWQIQYRNNFFVDGFFSNAQISASFIASPTVSSPAPERHQHQRGVRTVEVTTLRSLYGLISSTISTLSGYLSDEVQSLRISAPESQTGKVFSGVEKPSW